MAMRSDDAYYEDTVRDGERVPMVVMDGVFVPPTTATVVLRLS
jgi:hypothetical protein